ACGFVINSHFCPNWGGGNGNRQPPNANGRECRIARVGRRSPPAMFLLIGLEGYLRVTSPDLLTSAPEEAAPVHHDMGTAAGEGKKMFRKYLEAAIRHEASDLIVKVDLPPRIRVRGSLKSLQTDLCTPDLMFQIARDVLDER